MDTQSLLSDIKARFNHNAFKAHLKDKYDGKLIVAEQGGLWKATPDLIGYLASTTEEYVILIDAFENPVFVNRVQLHSILHRVYNDVMQLWYNEWKEAEVKR